VGAAGQAVAVDLQAVAQPGLHHPLALIDLVDEAVDVGDQLLVHPRR
jgi:hypothetical protein